MSPPHLVEMLLLPMHICVSGYSASQCNIIVIIYELYQNPAQCDVKFERLVVIPLMAMVFLSWRRYSSVAAELVTYDVICVPDESPSFQ